MIELPALVKLLMFVTALCYLALHAGGHAQPEPVLLLAPSEVCTSTIPDDQQTCLLNYLAEREYTRATDPAQVALTTSFPVLFVMFCAYLGMRFVRAS
jgi:hypothetical protein